MYLGHSLNFYKSFNLCTTRLFIKAAMRNFLNIVKWPPKSIFIIEQQGHFSLFFLSSKRSSIGCEKVAFMHLTRVCFDPPKKCRMRRENWSFSDLVKNRAKLCCLFPTNHGKLAFLLWTLSRTFLFTNNNREIDFNDDRKCFPLENGQNTLTRKSVIYRIFIDF